MKGNTMQVQIKQNEIEQAIRAFIANQGISLVGKEVKIDFTAGRKNGGLTADISIEEATPMVPVKAVNTAQLELPLETMVAEGSTTVLAVADGVADVAVIDPGYSTTAPSTPSLFS